MLVNTAIDLPLRPIQLPDPINFWPLAYGWWILILLILLALFLGIFCTYFFKKSSLKKTTLKELKRIESMVAVRQDPDECIREMSILLRRYVVSKDSKRAGVTGREWVKTLSDLSRNYPFKDADLQLITMAPYKKGNTQDEANALLNLINQWVKQS